MAAETDPPFSLRRTGSESFQFANCAQAAPQYGTVAGLNHPSAKAHQRTLRANPCIARTKKTPWKMSTRVRSQTLTRSTKCNKKLQLCAAKCRSNLRLDARIQGRNGGNVMKDRMLRQTRNRCWKSTRIRCVIGGLNHPSAKAHQHTLRANPCIARTNKTPWKM